MNIDSNSKNNKHLSNCNRPLTTLKKFSANYESFITFHTANIYLASFLKAKFHFNLLNTKVNSSNKVILFLYPSHMTPTDVYSVDGQTLFVNLDQYYSGDVNVQSFISALQFFKSQIFNALQSNKEKTDEIEKNRKKKCKM